ncbi:MAG: CDC48 family AAA ATPase [Candidatus Aenigmatarchaeota archaeon]
MSENGAKKDEIRLKVGELTSREEFGKGIARLDSQTMNSLGVSEGDVIEIEGKKKTGVIAVRSYPSDVGRNVIRIDGLIRKNAGTSLGEKVQVRKADVEEAKKVILAPAQKGLIIQMPPQTLRNKIHMRPTSKGDIIVPTPITKGGERSRRNNIFDEFFNMGIGDFTSFGSEARLAVVKTVPNGIVKITETTEVELKPQAVEIEEEKIPSVTYEDIGGLHGEIRKIREMIELPLKRPDVFRTLGMEPPKGVLLHGPPGTGKTLMAKAVANEAGAHFITLNGPEIMSKYYGESEKRLRELFEEAEENSPTIIFIDEIDAIASKRSEARGEVERRVVSTLLTEMDGLEARGDVIVIAATNRVDDIDPALRRPGRFDREIEIGVPDKDGREEILQIHTRQMPLDEVNLGEYSRITHGFVGADLEALTKEAGMHALRRVLPEISSLEEGEEIPEEVLNKLKVNQNDFDYALKMVEPSAMREVLVEVPKVKWSDIGGLEEQKERLKEAVEWPLTMTEDFEEMGIEPTKGLLLYGPPGTGKTLLAKAVANESDANFISVRGPELLSKWVGESEKRIREVFKRAKQAAPTIIFFDEIDSLAGTRGRGMGENVSERVLSQLLTEMSGLEEMHDVVVIAATNRPDMVDNALLRPGRFDKHLYIPSPDKEAREKIFEIHTRNIPLEDDVDIEKLAKETKNYSGADIQAVCREAAMIVLRRKEGASKVKMKDFEEALKETGPSLTGEIIETYENFNIEKSRSASGVGSGGESTPRYVG